MKLQKLLTSIFAAAVLVCSCEMAPLDGTQLPGNIKTDLTFKLEISDLTYNSVQIRVQHDGTTEDSWYGFLTSDLKKKDAALIAEKLEEITAGGEIKGLEKRTTKRIDFNDLEPATKYRYIAFAVTPDGMLYGNMASLEITTNEGFLLQTTEDWTVAYQGRDASTNEEIYDVTFNKNNAARCHVGFIPKWMVDAYEKEEAIQEELANYGGLRLNISGQVFLFSVLDYLVFEELYEYWGYYDGDESYYTQETFDATSQFKLPRQESGEYYAVAIGFKDKVPTFTYSSDLVTITKETASENYQNWLGNWTLTGANNITYNLRFEENDPNYSFYVYGWECNESVHTNGCAEDCKEHVLYTDFSKYELGIPFYYNALNGEMNISSKVLGVEAASSSSYLYWGMFGFTEYEGETVSILTEDDKIAAAAQAVDSKTTLNGQESITYKYGADENIEEVKFTYCSLGYVSYDDQSYIPQPWNLPLELPATMTKVASDVNPATKAMTSNKAVRKANAANSYNSIKKADYSKLMKADFLKK